MSGTVASCDRLICHQKSRTSRNGLGIYKGDKNLWQLPHLYYCEKEAFITKAEISKKGNSFSFPNLYITPKVGLIVIETR